MKSKAAILKVSKIGKSVSRYARKKVRKTQIININNEKRNSSIDPTGISRTVSIYYKQFHVNKLNNINKIGKLLERSNSKCDMIINFQIEQLQISPKLINNLSTKKPPGFDSFTDEFCQTFKKERMPVIQRLCQNIEEKVGNAFSHIL